MFLETDRLILRHFCEADFDDFFAFAADREMCRMMGRNDLTDIDAARQTFCWLKDSEERGYAIVFKKSGRGIGNLTVGQPSSLLSGHTALIGKRGCSLSFSISRHYQRRGLMAEAVRAVIDHLFAQERMDYINCGHFDFNIASRELQKKLGFQFFLSERIDINGEETEAIENILWNS